MYVARFELGSKRIVQGRVCIRSVSTAWLHLGAGAIEAIARARGAVACPLDLSIRVEVQADGSLSLIWAITAAEENEAALCKYVGAFTRLERLGVGSLIIPQDEKSFDELLTACPAARSRITCDGLSSGGSPIACDVRAIEWLDNLIVASILRRAPLVYQANIAEFDFPPSVVRQARVGAAQLGLTARVPTYVANKQVELSDRLATCCAMVEEFIATDEENAIWLDGTLRKSFQQDHGGLGLSEPGLAPQVNAFETELSSALHSIRFEPPTIDTCMAQAIDNHQLMRILSWQPDDHGAATIRWSRHDNGDDLAGQPFPSPTPHSSSSFKFVSYSHADIGLVRSVLKAAEDHGIPLWWDAQIPGGSEWDAELENRIERCSGVVLFLSDKAVNSKYVRREVKYADAIGKKILAIELNPSVQLAYGLGMLLRQYQRVPWNHPHLIDQLKL